MVQLLELPQAGATMFLHEIVTLFSKYDLPSGKNYSVC